MSGDEKRQELAKAFDRHVEEEGRILEEYRRLSESLEGGPLAFAVDLILTEEEMHHLLLRTMGDWLRKPEAAEKAAKSSAATAGDLLSYTEQLKKHERETIASCQALRDDLSKSESEVVASLLDVLVLDSEKHHRLLEVIEKLLR